MTLIEWERREGREGGKEEGMKEREKRERVRREGKKEGRELVSLRTGSALWNL